MDFYRYFKLREILLSSLFFLLIFCAYFIYLPGSHGVFAFDDMPNLSPMGRYSSLSLWDNFLLFILEGQSGPTGRPISLASFYLNDTNWPSLPASFIITNIKIHLLNGVLVFWLGIKFSSILTLSKAQQLIFSLIATSFWILHPMQTTTVLYIIQRMTELSATFMLMGILFYLYGREQLLHKPIKGFITLFIGVGVSLILAILSKENGVLLVAYILVIEYFLLQPLRKKPPKKFNYWLVPAVILPFVAIIIYLGLNTDPDKFSRRNFTLTERLLTEPRILFDYLHHIFIPNMEGITLFHDDYILSKSLLNPWTTLPSILGIIVLILASYLLRKRAPFIAFAIAWFFAGHIIESTVLPLELYFEHRNYLPILGISIALAWYTLQLMRSYRFIAILFFGSLITLNTFIVYQNTTLWGKPLELVINWYKTHPQSVRSRQAYLSMAKTYELPKSYINPQKRTDKSSMFYMTTIFNNLADACSSNSLTSNLLDSTLLKINNHTIHSTVGIALMDLFSSWQKNKCNDVNKHDMERFFLHLASLDKVKRIDTLIHNVHFALAEIYRKKRDLSNTIINLEKAYSYHPNYEILKLRASYLVTAGLYKEALEVLNDTNLLKRNIRERLAFKIQQKEFIQLKKLIQNTLKKNND